MGTKVPSQDIPENTENGLCSVAQLPEKSVLIRGPLESLKKEHAGWVSFQWDTDVCVEQ